MKHQQGPQFTIPSPLLRAISVRDRQDASAVGNTKIATYQPRCAQTPFYTARGGVGYLQSRLFEIRFCMQCTKASKSV